MSMDAHALEGKVVCGNCGTQIPTHCVYCPRCGAKRDSVDISSDQATQDNKWFSQAGDLDTTLTDLDARTDGLIEAPFVKTKDTVTVADHNPRDVVSSAHTAEKNVCHKDAVTIEDSGFVPEHTPFAGYETKNVPEKKTRYCTSCGKELKSGAKFCSSCGKSCTTGGINENRTVAPFGDASAETPVSRYEGIDGSSKSISFLCVILLAGCAVLWFVAPFIALNLLTFGNQPTAFEIVTGDVLLIGDLYDTTAFWAAAVSIIGIAICFVSEIASAHGTTCFFATITEIPLVIAMLDMFDWIDDLEYLLDIFGVGFWGILAMLFVVICVSAAKKLGEN